jgi:hypothetical protein
MTRTRKIKITAVRRRTWRAQPLLIRAHCPVCGREVETLAEGEAAGVLELDPAALAGLIAAGLVHAIPTVSGSFRVCQDSLFAR